MSGSEIAKFFKDQTLFITGGTGFLGKVLIEKLLRVCELRKIYILVRPKKGKSVEERIDEFFSFPCFDRLKNEVKDFKRRTCFVCGDCEAVNLGISAEDEKILIDETTLVIHAAANVKFDQTLRAVANANVRSTISMLHLAKKMTMLKAFVYVSTAYSNCIHKEIKEEIYTPPMTYNNLFSILDGIDDETLEKITPEILGKWPNTYVYTKSICEDAVATLGQNLPIAIVRPAIVTSSAEEPVPGWVDNFYGVMGIVIASCLGVLRSFLLHRGKTAHVVAIDYVSNLILAAAWKIQSQDENIKVYNYVGHRKNRLTWGELGTLIEISCWTVPSTKVIWYPCINVFSNELLHNACMFLLHTVPAYIADCVMFCIGQPTIAVVNCRRLKQTIRLISYFTTRSWEFQDDNQMKLFEEMGDVDKKLFKFTAEHLNWREYFRNGVLAGRVFLLKDPLETVPQGERKFRKLFIAHYSLLMIVWFMLYKIVMFIINCFM